MVDYITDVNRRMANTNLNEVMFDVSLDNTLTGLKQGKIKQTLQRLIGSKTGKHKVKTLKGKEKKAYEAIPESDRLTKHDIEQGSITISNIGSVYREQRGAAALIEIIPPQVTAIAVGAVQDKPVVIVNENNEKEIAIRQVLPFTIVFDHRALDFGDIVPFIKKLDEIFEEPEIIHTWKDGGTDNIDMEEIKSEREERELKYKQSKEREKALKEAEEKAKKAQREADKAQKEAEKALKEAEEKAQKAQKEAERALKEAEEKAQKAQKEAEEKARKEAERAEKEAQKAQKEAEEKAKREAEKLAKAQKEAEEKARKEAEKEEKIRREIERAQKEAEEALQKAEEAKLKAAQAVKDAEVIKSEPDEAE
jgi:pyruvate dehydrogenase E2 component (dihydrolipoamide acetyltransferase)